MGNQFNETVESLFRGMDSFISAKTVVGDAVRVDDKTIILPLVDVSFGVGAGAFSDTNQKQNAGGGLGGKMSPSSILVLQDGKAKLVNIKNQDTVTKVLDMLPDLLDRFKKKDGEDIEDSPELDEAIQKASE
ncbi:MAG: GerW family sporulation protein [Clostridiales bacterium]|nr:GerW family sporulation protein [Clostridiales bacterium]